MRYYLIAGEPSGDLHASHLMRELKKQDSDAQFRFFGGDLMAAEGGEPVKHYREMAFMGFIAVAANLKTVLANMKLCKKDIAQFAPDVVILVDYPGFNMKIAKYVKHTLHIPVHYYILPKVWAWKEYRVKAMRRSIDRFFSILPFEIDFFSKHRIEATYVGNPTLEELENREMKDESFECFIAENGLCAKPIIALLAGSRKAEIKDNLPTMVAAASRFPQFQFVVAGAPGLTEQDYRTHLPRKTRLPIVFGATYRLLQQSSIALVTSGTATLETALLGVPQIVCYKMDVPPIVQRIFMRILKVQYVSLVNLIANKSVVPELLGINCTTETITDELQRLLRNEDSLDAMVDDYNRVATVLGENRASATTAKIIYESLY